MKLMSWNVNGIRAILKTHFFKEVERLNPDVLCVQETKIHDDHVDPKLLHIEGYHFYWNSAQKKGYSGVAVFTKKEPLSIQKGMSIPEHDKEGRILVLEFEKFFLVNVYAPNAQRRLTRLKYRQQWNHDFLHFVKKLEKKKPVVICGDLNVAHTEIDLKNPTQNRKNAGFTDEERADFTALLRAGFLDTFREFEKGPGHYTWWSYMFNARARNIGWRIDYFLISPSLRKRLKKAEIHSHVYGSDHCPVSIELDF